MGSCAKCETSAPRGARWDGLLQPTLWRVVATGALIATAWVTHAAGVEPQWVSMVCGVAAAVLAGGPIAVGAFRALLRRSISVDLLVTLAIVASLAAREYHAAGMVGFIMLLGDHLQSVASARTERALQELVALAPDSARVRRGGAEVEVPVEDVAVGEVCVVRPGEKVPVDGDVVAGDAAVDEATITGESVPVDKSPGAPVYGGTIVHGGALDVRATRVGEDTAVARLARLVEEAHRSKAPVERVADRFASWFVPVALAIAAAVGIASGEISRAITVMVVACPCALVIGTPAAILAGIGAAARRGILIRGGAHLEALARATTIALDKTGTLTTGRPEVVAVHPVDGRTRGEVLRLAGIAEKRSDHPIARAIVRAAEAESGTLPDPESFAADQARGVSARHGDLRLLAGSRAYFDAQGVGVADDVVGYMSDEEEHGRTPVLIGADGHALGVVSVADTLRPTARAAVAALKAEHGTTVVMLTGDNERAARAMAEQVGIDEVESSMLPEDKLAHVRRRVEAGERVAMVGDGVNDAPALAAATVGIAMGAAGSDVAIEAADIALMSDDVSHVAEAVALSRKTLRTIRQNFLFAILFNGAAMAFASFAVVGVVGGAVLHQISSLFVILNALRLLRQAGRRSGGVAGGVASAAEGGGSPRLASCCATSREAEGGEEQEEPTPAEPPRIAACCSSGDKSRE